MPTYLSTDQLSASLGMRDLTDPAAGPHAMQELLGSVVKALSSSWGVSERLMRISPLVLVEDNYDRLGFDTGAITRDTRYSRYVSATVMLRSHTSASIPPLLRSLDPSASLDELVVLPGLVYRRDAIDRTHVGEPHQVDLWRVSSKDKLTSEDLDQMLGTIVEAVLPGARWRAVPAVHPYTEAGRQLDVLVGGEWLELAECGLIDPTLLSSFGLDPARWSGLALGMGLDRALMLRKGIDDIRMLRASEPRSSSRCWTWPPGHPSRHCRRSAATSRSSLAAPMTTRPLETASAKQWPRESKTSKLSPSRHAPTTTLFPSRHVPGSGSHPIK